MSFEGSFAKIGSRVRVESDSGVKEGYAVIYPSRYKQALWGGVENQNEGRAEVKRFFMFCGMELLKGAGYGSVIIDGGSRFMLVWKDEFLCRLGGYTKASLRKMTEEG